MMKVVEENRTCFQCAEVKQVVTFTVTETGHENAICESCLNNYIDGKVKFD